MVWGTGNFKSCDSLLKRVEQNDPALQELVILPMKNFESQDMERLASIIASGNNTNLKSISASGHKMSTSALRILGEAIASTASAILRIKIGDSNMGDEGVQAFCSSLESVRGGLLENIDFAFKDISKESIRSIGKTFGNSYNIKSLYLYRNAKIGDEGMIMLFHTLTEQESSTPKPFMPNLEHLDLSECNIGSNGVDALARCFKLNIPDLTETTATDDSKNSYRKPIYLNLSKNTLGPSSCISLSSLCYSNSIHGSMIKSLVLKNCSIGDEGMRTLANAFKERYCEGLTILDLTGNDIKETGCLDFAAALSQSKDNIKNLNEVCLADNPIGSYGITTFAQSLKQQFGEAGNPFLSNVDLSNTECGLEGAVSILKCGSLCTVRLFNNNLGSDGFKALVPFIQGGHKNIATLDLSGNRAQEDGVVSILRAIAIKNEPDESALRTFVIGANEFGDEAEQVLKELKRNRPELDIARSRPKVDQDLKE